MTSLIISAGRGCFMSCKGCYQYFGENERELSTKELILFINKFKTNFDLSKVTLSGGDPLTRKDILS